ncbi:hypothetical protein HanXRQr2_Chr04g0183431 [Helianthus annuus]|uniref:Uncharacterized protein n=1 Tax=Helianthus annuus TaxID=4232 RepID=A0A9K3JAK6_HELAN|nr:hypothetical protein HanXRQr2_Chr04g0183431 [Helianthus annuus]KAJ0932724.1 hypothetical protein HanPSC8_Chr04g0176901 [Helianthus annuus]
MLYNIYRLGSSINVLYYMLIWCFMHCFVANCVVLFVNYYYYL